MATKLEEFTFLQAGGRQTRYSWDEWCDGNIWKAKKDEDFTTTSINFGAALYDRAMRMRKGLHSGGEAIPGQRVRVTQLPDDEVVFQFYVDEGTTTEEAAPTSEVE